MSTKTQLLLQIRELSREELNRVVEFLQNEPLNDAEVCCKGSHDDVVQSLRDVDKALLQHAYETVVLEDSEDGDDDLDFEDDEDDCSGVEFEN